MSIKYEIKPMLKNFDLVVIDYSSFKKSKMVKRQLKAAGNMLKKTSPS